MRDDDLDDDDDSAANDMVQVCVFGGDFIQGQQLHIYTTSNHTSRACSSELSEPRAAVSRLSRWMMMMAARQQRRGGGDNETAWSMEQGVFRGNFIQGQQCTYQHSK